MAKTRSYKRDRNGRFSSSGTHVTVGNAGGFANATHRAAVQRTVARRARKRQLVGRSVGLATGAVAAVALARALR